MLSDSGYVCVPAILAVQAFRRMAAQQLLVKMFAEAFAHHVEGKWVHTGAGEGQDASAHTGDEMAQ